MSDFDGDAYSMQETANLNSMKIEELRAEVERAREEVISLTGERDHARDQVERLREVLQVLFEIVWTASRENMSERIRDALAQGMQS